jgi:hypothetical protein
LGEGKKSSIQDFDKEFFWKVATECAEKFVKDLLLRTEVVRIVG